MLKQRNVAIDILKVIGVICVLNSHLDVFYGNYSYLATGGTIGNALFFFCSGFTLFLNKKDVRFVEFPNWYKRRFNRIYPTVFAVSIISCLLLGYGPNLLKLLIFGGGWFVPCIMVYYILCYALVAINGNKKNAYALVILGVIVATIIIYINQALPQSPYNMFSLKESNLCLISFFACMVLGVYTAKNDSKCLSTKVNVILSVFFLMLFYAIYIVSRRFLSIYYLQPFCMLPLLGFVYFFYYTCNCYTLKNIYRKPGVNYAIMFVSGLCLEMYLCQDSILTIASTQAKEYLDSIFPFGILLIVFVVFGTAIIAKCFSGFISQTMKDGDYNWRKIFVWYK